MIVDQFGNPIKAKQLERSQVDEALSMLGGLKNTFNDDTSKGLTVGRLVQIMQAAEAGDLDALAVFFEKMEEKDGHIFAEMSKRKRVITTLDWDIKPPRNPSQQELQNVEWVKEVIGDLPDFEDLIFDLADAIGKGFSNVEMCWEKVGSEMLPCSFDWQHQKLFTINPNNPNELLIKNGSNKAQKLWPFSWITHQHKAKSGYLHSNALFRVLAWPYLFKNYSVRDLAEFLEIYGLPLRLGKYPSVATEDEKRTLLRAVLSIGHSAGGIIPQGMEIDFQAAAQGTEGPFKSMIDWCEKTQSKAILGATLTSQADGKSSTNALGNVHNEVRHELLESDAKQIAKTLTVQLIYPLLAVNKSNISDFRRCPRFEFDTQESEDVQLLADAMPRLVNELGMKIPADYLHDKLKIPKAEDDESYVLGSASPTYEPVTMAALNSKDEPLNKQIKQVESNLDDLMTALLDPVRELVNTATSLEEIRDGILALYNFMPHDQIAVQLEQALIAAQLLGRFEADSGELD